MLENADAFFRLRLDLNEIKVFVKVKKDMETSVSRQPYMGMELIWQYMFCKLSRCLADASCL